MVKITSVEHGSYCDSVGIKAGDMLLCVNGNEIKDVLDYRFHIMNKKLTISICRDGEVAEVSFKKKDEYDDIGLEFETYLMDSKHSCRNKCVFCFIDQNPPGMRESIYFKDDDDRLSFFFGNYVTLTNLSSEEVERLIRMRISPVNISVHTTNPELRCKMMNNRFAGDALKYLDAFRDGEIRMNCQIVLCKGLNDKKELEKSLADLSAYYPWVESIAVVPAGLTGHRQNLYPLSPFTKADALEVINMIDKAGKSNLETFGARLVYASDEWYLKAGLEIPDSEYYEDFPQLDNGVGMIRSLGDEIEDELVYLSEDGIESLDKPRSISIVTGESAYAFIKECAQKVCSAVDNLKCTVYCAKNNFFGGGVTVAGLVTGSDILNAVGGQELGDELLIPEVMLRHEKDLFLDNMSIDELSDKLGVAIRTVENTGLDFVNAMLGR